MYRNHLTNEYRHPASRPVIDENTFENVSKSSKHQHVGKHCITIAHINVATLLPKISEIRHIIHEQNINVLSVQESRLNHSVFDKEIEIDGFILFRNDQKRTGGGVAIYVHSKLLPELCPNLQSPEIECIWITITLKSRKILVGSIYRLPSAKASYTKAIFNCIENAVTFNDDLVVLGDLNWDYNRYPDKKFISYIENSCGLTQIIHGPTRVTPSSQSSIDLIFTSYPIFHINTSIIKYTLSDHFFITTQVTAKISNTYCTNSIRKRSLRKFNKSLFIKDLYHSKVFRDILSLQSVNTAWNNWIYEYRRICDIHAPIHFVRSKQKQNFFISRELLDKMYQRDHIHFKAIIPRSHYRAITTIALIMSDRDIQAKTKI